MPKFSGHFPVHDWARSRRVAALLDGSDAWLPGARKGSYGDRGAWEQGAGPGSCGGRGGDGHGRGLWEGRDVCPEPRGAALTPREQTGWDIYVVGAAVVGLEVGAPIGIVPKRKRISGGMGRRFVTSSGSEYFSVEILNLSHRWLGSGKSSQFSLNTQLETHPPSQDIHSLPHISPSAYIS